MIVFIARHAETDLNKNKLIQGQTNPPLNSTGWKQARQLEICLANEGIQNIDSSDLLRVVSTAGQIQIAHPHLVVNQHEALRERAMGIYEGRPIAEYQAVVADAKLRQRVPYHQLKIDTVEEIPSMINRLIPYLQSLFSHNYDTVLIVASHVVNLGLIHLLTNTPHEELGKYPQPQACLNKIEVSEIGNGKIIFAGSTEHLFL